jgi:hypothetical protein
MITTLATKTNSFKKNKNKIKAFRFGGSPKHKTKQNKTNNLPS